jgi:hypothetical protein
VLGFDFFAGVVVDLDLDGGRITLFDPAKSGVNPDTSVAALDLARGVPAIRAKVDKRIAVDALLDTTGGDAIALPDSLSPSVTLKHPPGTVDSDTMARCGILDSIQIGMVSYEEQPACFMQNGSSVASIGYEFLRQLNVTFDYPDAAIALVPRHRDSKLPTH